MARPIEYDPKYIAKIEEYLQECKDTSENIIESENAESGRIRYIRRYVVKLPTIEGFANYIGVSRKSLYNWEKTHEDFGFELERIKNEQLMRLLNEGLAGNYNPTIAKLVLSSNHGMRERVDNTSDDKPLTSTLSDEQVKRIAERVVRRKASDGDKLGTVKSN